MAPNHPPTPDETTEMLEALNDITALRDEERAYIVTCVKTYERDQEIKNKLLSALKALGEMPGGYCFCPGHREASRRVHIHECIKARHAISKAEGP